MSLYTPPDLDYGMIAGKSDLISLGRTTRGKPKASLHLHKGQTRAWASMRRFIFIVAGTQSGKTTFGPWLLWRETERLGPGDYLAVTATYDLFKLKMLPEMLKVFTQHLPDWRWVSGDRMLVKGKGDNQYRIILRSANAPGGLESATAKAAWLDECGQDDFRLESWEAVLRRLSLSQGRVFGTTTPYNLGWLKTEIYDRWRAGDPNYDVIQFRSTENPRFPMEEYNRAKATMPTWKFNMFYNGEFTRPAGLIFGDYVDEYVEKGGHKVHPFHIPANWPRYVGVDFGAINTAMIWIAFDPDKQVYYVYRESLQGDRTTNEHAAEALKLAKTENVIRWVGGNRSEKQQRWDWQAANIPLEPCQIIEVEPGIDRVISLFKQRQMFVFDSCTGLRDELGTYSRVLDQRGQPTDVIKDKDRFHHSDALRYCVSVLDGMYGGWSQGMAG